jgi:hypothetical protein
MAAWCDLAVETAVLNDACSIVGGESNLVETAVLNDTYSSANPGIKVVESAVLNDTTTQHGALVNYAIEAAFLNDDFSVNSYNNVVEVAVLNDANSLGVSQVVKESAILNDANTFYAVKSNLVVETAVLNDFIGVHWESKAVEVAVLNDAVSQLNAPTSLAVETAVLNDHAASTMFDYLAETAVLNDATTQHFVGYDNAVDLGYLSDAVSGGGAGIAWRTNLDTLPMSRYSNQPWQSMASVNGVVLMADVDGLYVRSGNTDAGVAIGATIEHDLLDKIVGKDGKPVESRKVKRPRFAYLDYTSSGPLMFSLGHVTGSSEQTQGYTFPAARATQFSNNRVALGRGIRSRYLRPTIANVAGDDFTLGDGTMIVDELDRSI